MEIQWPLVIFSLLAGGGAATLGFAGISEFLGSSKKARSIAGIIALALMVIGGIASVFHLGQPGNFFAAVANLGSLSGVSLELIFLGLTIVVGIVYVVLVNGENAASKAVGVVGLVLAVIFAAITGHSYQIEAQLAWNNFGVTASYLFSSFTLGGFVYLATATVFKEDGAQVKKIALYTLVVAVLQLISFFIFGFAVGFDKLDVVSFWLLAVVVGSLVPIAIAGLFAFKDSQGATAYAGLAGALLGGIGIRVFMWIVGSGFISFFTDAAAYRSLFPL
jgi:anaerobic dimethyl sulfoxide reductase subunit C (anchor subunit)